MEPMGSRQFTPQKTYLQKYGLHSRSLEPAA